MTYPTSSELNDISILQGLEVIPYRPNAQEIAATSANRFNAADQIDNNIVWLLNSKRNESSFFPPGNIPTTIEMGNENKSSAPGQ